MCTELIQAALIAEVIPLALVVDVTYSVLGGDGHPADGVQHFGRCLSDVNVRMA
jgi:hypothetical protein